VKDLLSMPYKNRNIGIIVTCPDMYKEGFFKKGKMYEVSFSDTNPADFEWTVGNRNLLKKNGLLFDPYAVSVKKIQ